MTIEDDIAFLERVPILRRLGAPALAHPRDRRGKPIPHAGQLLFAAGDPADCGYIVQRGSFELCSRPRDREDEAVVGPGTLLGESALLPKRCGRRPRRRAKIRR